MEYAVIRTGGKQYKASVGDVLEIDKLELGDKKTLTFEEVLLVANDGKASVGTPLLAGAKVQATLLDQFKGDKIRVTKFKAKSRYRRTIGFRSLMTRVKIDKIDFGAKKVTEKVVKPTKTAPKTKKVI